MFAYVDAVVITTSPLPSSDRPTKSTIKSLGRGVVDAMILVSLPSRTEN